MKINQYQVMESRIGNPSYENPGTSHHYCHCLFVQRNVVCGGSNPKLAKTAKQLRTKWSQEFSD